MARIVSVIIGIQARSTSTRLPGKGLRLMAGRPMIEWVVDACTKSARYLSTRTHSIEKIVVDVKLLVPAGDEITSEINSVPVLEGSHDDVLSRYVEMAKEYNPDYIVRITGDCPLIPDHVITHMIKTAVANTYDYLSNVDEDCRTDLDGIDCEVMSKKALNWLDQKGLTDEEKEHVTIHLRKTPPSWAMMAFSICNFDFSALKKSVDNEEDFLAVDREILKLQEMKKLAEAKYGKRIHRH